MGEETVLAILIFPYVHEYLKKTGFYSALEKLTGVKMVQLPPTVRTIGKRIVKEALEEEGYTPDRAKKIDKIDSVKQVVGPISGTVQVTADQQAYTVIDTSQVAKVANLPHELVGSIDLGDFVSKAPDSAYVVIEWIVDGLTYIKETFYKSDLVDEPLVLIPGGRRALKSHVIKITFYGSGASSSNPINVNYGFTLDVGFLPITP